MAKIKEEDIDALRERADIVEVVSGYTNLKKAGASTYKGLCPMHSEKTPSFTVNAAKGLVFCFGCQKGGNIYHFIQEVEGLPFPEAVEWLARKVGFDLRYEEMRPGEAKATGIKARVVKANDEAARFFHRTLMNSPDALDARRYLEKRGFGPEVARRWLLGYAPGRDALYKHLLGKGFSATELEQADLIRRSDRGSIYDNFRQRITFPTWSLQGDVVAFGARALGEQQPKYLNTAETPVFTKSRVMYGLDRAKSAIARGSALVVEGYTDVIALHEAGITEAVATNGVALGQGHFEMIKKFSQRVVLMLDADQAGQGATERSFELHHRLGIEVLVAPLPAGRDPADVALEDGAEAVHKVIDAAKPLMEFKVDQMLSKIPLDTPEARARAVRSVIAVLLSHPDPIARHQYASMVAERVGVDPDAIERALNEELTSGFSQVGGEPSERDSDRRLPGHVKVEREALQLLLSRTTEARAWADDLEPSDFTSPARREVFEVARRAAQLALADARIAQNLSSDALSLYSELSIAGDERAPIDAAAHARELFTRLKVFRLERDIKARRETLQELNPLEEPDKHDRLFTELVALEARRRDLMRTLQGAA